jgi:hypothetical protein
VFVKKPAFYQCRKYISWENSYLITIFKMVEAPKYFYALKKTTDLYLYYQLRKLTFTMVEAQKTVSFYAFES